MHTVTIFEKLVYPAAFFIGITTIQSRWFSTKSGIYENAAKHHEAIIGKSDSVQQAITGDMSHQYQAVTRRNENRHNTAITYSQHHQSTIQRRDNLQRNFDEGMDDLCNDVRRLGKKSDERLKQRDKFYERKLDKVSNYLKRADEPSGVTKERFKQQGKIDERRPNEVVRLIVGLQMN